MNRTQADRGGYLYLFQQEGADLYKIGATRNIRQRLATINTTMPYKIVLVESYPLTDYIRKVELCVQEQLKDYRLNGEWFKLPDLTEWHKIVAQLPMIETLAIFKHTHVPNVGRPRKYSNELLQTVTAKQLMDTFKISKQQAHQLLKRCREEM
jgi:hypothetical protein